MAKIALTKENGGIVVRAAAALILTFGVQLVVAVAVLLIDENLFDSMWFNVALEAGCAVVGLAFFLHLGGKRLLGGPRAVFETFRFGWWSLFLTSALGAYAFYEYLSEGYEFSATWQTDFVQVALYCLAIGFFEEIIFRGLLLNGLLALLGSTMAGVWLSVLVSCAIFGMAHVDTETDFATPVQAAQALLKALQTGSWSFLLAVCVLRNRDLAGPALFHGVEDFLPSVGSIFFAEEFLTDYVTEDVEDGWFTALFYLVVVVLYLPFIIKSARWLLREGHPDLGAFSQVELVPAGDAEVVGLSAEAELLQVAELPGDGGLQPIAAAAEAPASDESQPAGAAAEAYDPQVYVYAKLPPDAAPGAAPGHDGPPAPSGWR